MFDFLNKKEQVIDDIEVKNLDMVITQFVLPRLKIFRENLKSSPIFNDKYHLYQDTISRDNYKDMEEEWAVVIDKMILAFEYYNQDITFPNNQDSIYEEGVQRKMVIQEGFELFGKYLSYLWE